LFLAYFSVILVSESSTKQTCERKLSMILNLNNSTHSKMLSSEYLDHMVSWLWFFIYGQGPMKLFGSTEACKAFITLLVHLRLQEMAQILFIFIFYFVRAAVYERLNLFKVFKFVI